MRPWEWAQGYVWGTSALLYVKYRCQNDLTYIACYIKNPFDCSAISNAKPFKQFDVTAVGSYYFKITISLKNKPAALKGIPLYFTGMEIGKQFSSTQRSAGFLSSVADLVYYSKEPEQINAQANINFIDSNHALALQDFIPADTDINKIDGYSLDKPLQIFIKVTVDFISTTGYGQVYFYPRLWIDYKYTDQIGLGELPSINDGSWAYYGYGASNRERLNELARKVQVNAADQYNQLTSDEKKELLQLTNLGMGLKISQIDETEFNQYAQKYGTTN